MKESFAFILHPRDITDAPRKYPWFSILPPFIINFICRYIPPMIGGKITGLKSATTGNPVEGYILICPFTAKQLMENRKLGKKRVKDTLRLAEKLGVKIVGLGALTSSITAGGKDLLEGLKIGITNGHSLTVGMSLLGIKKAAKIKNINLNSVTLGMVGATGSIGEALSRLLAAEGVKKFILVAKKEEQLVELKKEMEERYKGLEINISTRIDAISDADLVVVTTASPEVLIKANHLKKNAIVYDVTQPQNTSIDILEKRKDLFVIDGGIVNTPNIKSSLSIGLAEENAFACLAEVMILAAENRHNVQLVDRVKIEDVKEMLSLAEKYNFTVAPFRSFGKLIQSE